MYSFYTAGNEHEIKRVSDTTKSDISQPVTTAVSAASGSIPSPLEVSLQSVPQPSADSVLAKYKQYLQSCYNAIVLAPADKYLPTLKAPYINLAMIKKGRYSNEQTDEFTRRTLHGGVDEILEIKTPINIEDLLTPEDKDERSQMRIEDSDWLVGEGIMMPFRTAKNA